MNSHFRPNRLIKEKDTLLYGCMLLWMNPIHTDTLQHSLYFDSRVGISVCAFYSNATLNLFGQSETVRRRILFWLTATYFQRIHLDLFFSPLTSIRFGGSVPLSEVIQ